MKEIIDIIKAYDAIDKSSVKVVLATVIDVRGSSYRRTGARMLIRDDGIWVGGISGGCLEGDVLRKAFLALASNSARIITYDTSADNEEIGASLGCNGIIDILLSPIDYSDVNNQIEVLRSLIGQRKPSILITVAEATGTASELIPGKIIKPDSADPLPKNLLKQTAIDNVRQRRKSTLKTFADYRLFIEYVAPSIQLIIMGGNYDVYPLLKIAKDLCWQVIIVANPKRLDKSLRRLADKTVVDFEDIELDDYSVGILMSHDINTDFINLEKSLKTSLAYIGMLGPTTRKADILAKLPYKLSRADELRLFGPAGLDIGAAQPEEIAIAIIAEILTFMRQRNGSSLRLRKKPIYTP